MKNSLVAILVLAIVSIPGIGFGEFSISLWKGETYSFRQRVTNPGAAWDSAQIRIVSPSWTNVPAGFVAKAGVLESVKTSEYPGSADYLLRPDVVKWHGSCSLRGKESSVVVGQLTASSEIAAGEYVMFFNGEKVMVRVVDRTLPPVAERRYFLDLWQHPWAVARYFGVAPFSEEHYARMRPLWTELAQAGQRTITTTILDKPWNHQCQDAYGTMIRRIKHDDGSWTFDYTLFDDYVAFCRSCGLGPDICCYTMVPWGDRVNWENESGETVYATVIAGTIEYEEYWGAFLADFTQHLAEKGWLNNTYISMDERPAAVMAKAVSVIRTYGKGLKISTAGNSKPSDFKGIVIENYCQYVEHITSEFLAEAETRRAEGMRTTYYVCCGPDYPNTFLVSDPDESFWVGVYPAFVGLDGFLRWAYNSWPLDPYQDATYGNWRGGDTYLVYPNGEPSYRFLELQNGIQQAEKVNVLKAKGELPTEFSALRETGEFKKMNGALKKGDLRKLQDIKAWTLKLLNKI